MGIMNIRCLLAVAVCPQSPSRPSLSRLVSLAPGEAMTIVEASNEPRPHYRPSRLVQIVRFVPMFGPVLVIYGLFAVMGFPLDPKGAQELFSLNLVSGAQMHVHANDLFLMGVVLLLFVELIKASSSTNENVFLEHIFSTFVFIGFVVMFLLVKECGNSTFLILTLMPIVDVLAGWTISYRAALRDIAYQP